MSFQIKVIIITSLTLIVVLLYLNTMVINYMDFLKQELILTVDESDRFSRMAKIERSFESYLVNVLLWEFLLVLALMLILYKVISKMIKQERDYMDFLELLLLIISHKFGNLLASQRGNIEILKMKYDQRAIERLERVYELVKEDLDSVLSYIEKFKNLSAKKERISMNELVKRALKFFEEKAEFFVSEQECNLYAHRQLVENIVIPLVENSVKYSSGRVSIRLTRNYFAIRNRISKLDRGTGVGLKIAERLAKKEGFRLINRSKNGYFISVLRFRV